MSKTTDIIATELTNSGKILNLKQGSVFEVIDYTDGNDVSISEFANKIAMKMQNELSFIKGKLIPLMNDYVDNINKKVANIHNENPLTNIVIIEQTVHSLFKELKEKKVLGLKRAPLNLPITSINIPIPSITEIRSYFKHSNPVINDSCELTVNSYTDEELSIFFGKFFNNVSGSNVEIDILARTSKNDPDILVLLFVILSNIKEVKQPGVSADTDKYISIMRAFYAEILNYMSIAIDTHAVNKRLHRVVLSITNESIIVNGDVYEDFLNEGGSPEALLGMFVLGVKDVNEFILSNIMVRLDNYKTAWYNKIKAVRANNIAGSGKQYKALYSISLIDLYSEIIPKDLHEHISVTVQEAEKMLVKKMNDKKLSELTDTSYMAREIIAHIVFNHSNFHAFTDYMIEYSKLDKTLAPNEAASFASLEIVMDYLLQQVVAD